jgi:hypothetical protein
VKLSFSNCIVSDAVLMGGLSRNVTLLTSSIARLAFASTDRCHGCIRSGVLRIAVSEGPFLFRDLEQIRQDTFLVQSASLARSPVISPR